MTVKPDLARRTGLIAATVLALPVIGQAEAAAWQVSGPRRPAAGEAATYVVRGPSGRDYDIVVTRRARCARDLVAGDPAQTLARRGFLDSNGVDGQQLSSDDGRSMMCLYDGGTASIVDSKTIRTSRGRDRLRLTITNTTNSDADVRATGYVGREGDPLFADAADQHRGTVLVTARPPQSRCPRAAPDSFAPRTGSQEVATARFAVDLMIIGALTKSSRPRLCGYLVASRRHAGSIDARTVATASADVLPAAESLGHNGERIATITTGLILAIGAIASVALLARRRHAAATPAPLARARADMRAPVGQAHPAPIWPTPAPTPTPDVVPWGDDASFAIQRAVVATAAVFRDRLETILHTRDGEAWLAALNERRRSDMLAKGQRVPHPYATFEPRAVLNCLAYDPAGLQLIDARAAAAARHLAGLSNAAHHPDPANPLTNDDAERAWRLYGQITGHPGRATQVRRAH